MCIKKEKIKILILLLIVIFVIVMFLYRISINEFIVAHKIEKAMNTKNLFECEYNIKYILDAQPSDSEGYSLNTESFFVSTNTNKIIYFEKKEVKLPSIGGYKYYSFVKIDDLQEKDLEIFQKYLNGKQSYPPKKGDITITKNDWNSYTSEFGKINDESKTSDIYKVLERVKNK